MGLISLLSAGLIFGQVVQYPTTDGYAEVRGTPEQLVRFYEEWREYAAPGWGSSRNKAWWAREYDRVKYDSKSKRILYNKDFNTQRSLLYVATLRGYVIWFKVTVTPFGSFWVPYSSLWHAVLSVFVLSGFAWWFRRRTFHRRVGNAFCETTTQEGSDYRGGNETAGENKCRPTVLGSGDPGRGHGRTD